MPAPAHCAADKYIDDSFGLGFGEARPTRQTSYFSPELVSRMLSVGRRSPSGRPKHLTYLLLLTTQQINLSPIHFGLGFGEARPVSLTKYLII